MQFFELVRNTKKRTSHKDLSNTCGLSLTHLCCVYSLYEIKIKKSTLFSKKNQTHLLDFSVVFQPQSRNIMLFKKLTSIQKPWSVDAFECRQNFAVAFCGLVAALVAGEKGFEAKLFEDFFSIGVVLAKRIGKHLSAKPAFVL